MDERNGLGLPGAKRLERVERMTERIEENLNVLDRKVTRFDDRQVSLIERLDKHDKHHENYEKEHEGSHRGLNWRWYGVVGAATVWALKTIYDLGGARL